jgi:hypothetical protein
MLRLAICFTSILSSWDASLTSLFVPMDTAEGKLYRRWEYVHVAIDDHSRIAFTQILSTFTAASAIAFLRASVAYYASLGIPIRRLLNDNGHCYRSTLSTPPRHVSPS